jgi:glycosyltransferase involved in cell wall biosynthesis
MDYSQRSGDIGSILSDFLDAVSQEKAYIGESMSRTEKDIQISVVVPIYNEKENVTLLFYSIKEVLSGLGKTYEIVFVDDGSRDGTREILIDLCRNDSVLKGILLRRNFGQSAAMAAGFRASRGEIVVAMDGDLQNDPKDIPNLLEKIDQGYDVVSGWRKNRKDKLILRKIPSRIANRLICSVTDVNLHDTGCSLKAFRKEVIQRIRLYGELHRFIPALARVEGARISEVVVNHHPRRFGKSKYNITRTFRVLMDLMTLNLFLKYLRNPLRFFGKIGTLFLTLGFIGTCWIMYQVFVTNLLLEEMNVLVTLIFLLWITGFQFVFLGLVASLIVKTGDRRGMTLPPIIHAHDEA